MDISESVRVVVGIGRIIYIVIPVSCIVGAVYVIAHTEITILRYIIWTKVTLGFVPEIWLIKRYGLIVDIDQAIFYLYLFSREADYSFYIDITVLVVLCSLVT